MTLRVFAPVLAGLVLVACAQAAPPPSPAPPPVVAHAPSAPTEETAPETPDAGLIEAVAWLRRVSRAHADLDAEGAAALASVRIDGDYESHELDLLGHLPALREVMIWRDGETFARPGPRPAPSDDDLERLAQVTGLRSLTIGGWSAPFTDEGLRRLSAHGSLERLKLTQAMRVTDAGMRHVAAMPRLHALDITTTKITEAGLAHLLGSATLRDVSFGWAAASRRALRRFQAAHPERRFLLD